MLPEDQGQLPDYPDSVLSSVLENIRRYGCEYYPVGQSISILKQPLMTYAVSHPSFGVNSNQVDDITQRITAAGFKVVREPWNAFWGQRYAVVEDPDGYRIDLYAML